MADLRSDEGAVAAVAAAFRSDWGRLVASLIQRTGDWDLAQDCAQDAFDVALQRWPVDGIPDKPGAWLMTVARNRAIDRLRRDAVGAAKLRELAAESSPEPEHDPVSDDRLQLIFTCCHPALALEARVALTLRTLTGLSTAEVARALLVSEPTMAKRLVRAKRKIQHAGIPYRVPPAALLPERVSGVLAVLYLLFNEGYSASTGADLVRRDLCEEAIRLTRLLVDLMPADVEARGLLALMLLHHARRATRVNADDELITLAEQDRSRWLADEIDEGLSLIGPADGPYQLQAAIAACHASAGTAEQTDWPQIAELYRRLATLLPSPVVELNRAVAVGMADGPAAGLVIADRLTASGTLAGYHLLSATRADFLRRLDRPAEAAAAYREALALAGTDAERAFLRRRLADVERG